LNEKIQTVLMDWKMKPVRTVFKRNGNHVWKSRKSFSATVWFRV